MFMFQVGEVVEDSNAKRSKSNEGEKNENGQVKAEEESKGGANSNNGSDEKQNKSNSKPPEPPKDYIHVRARRGQATDSHSLAERVRNTVIFITLMILTISITPMYLVSRVRHVLCQSSTLQLIVLFKLKSVSMSMYHTGVS